MLSAIVALASGCTGVVVPLTAAKPSSSLAGVQLLRASDGELIDLGTALAQTKDKTLLVLGSHPGDFNTIEYCQRVRAFWPELQAKGVARCLMVVNGESIGIPIEMPLKPI